MTPRTAILFGATGLVGRCLLVRLLSDRSYGRVIVFSRRKPDIRHGKLDVRIIDFGQLKKHRKLFKGADDVFWCMGTTRKKTRSRAVYRWIDRDMPAEAALIAHKMGVPNFLVISSLGANPKALTFYMRTKGEMEERVSRYDFEKLAIIRPSLLLGKREERRWGESVGGGLYRLFTLLMVGGLRKYRAIKGDDVAKAMVVIAKGEYDGGVYLSDELQRIAEGTG